MSSAFLNLTSKFRNNCALRENNIDTLRSEKFNKPIYFTRLATQAISSA